MDIKKFRILVVLLISVVLVGCATPEHERIAVPEFPPTAKPMKPVKVALVLSSGGFRGGAHIGVLEVLEEHKIPVDLIVGSSAGSFIGAFYADNPNAKELKDKLLGIRYKTLIDTSWSNAIQCPFCPTGPIKGSALQKFMRKNMQAKEFDDLKIPLVVVTTSLLNNQMTVLRSGPVIPAVHASIALPPYFAPVYVYQDAYTDGGVIAPVPVSVARQFSPKLVIAVDISRRPSLTELKNVFQITGRAMDISFHQLADLQAKSADIVIRPDIIGFGPFDDDYNHDIYMAGRRAALQQIETIKQAVLSLK